MLVSYSWIKKYVDIDIDAYELAEKLTNAGVIVDNVYDLSTNLDNCVIGKLEEVKKHENSDRLFICKVNVGDEILQIVTAAENVEQGQLVPVAKPGAHLPNGLKIKKSKLRGETSNGMLISLEELNYETKVMRQDEKEGIFIFPEGSVEIGQSVESAFSRDDYLLELDLTPNRSDCSSIYGLAIEVGAILNKEVKLPKYDLQPDVKVDDLVIEIQNESLCPHYYGIVFELTDDKESPLWMQNTLRHASMRPTNLVVDIANFVMLETGQPLHTFDYDKIKDNKIIVREAVSGEVLKTLDESERVLSSDNLVIADSTDPVAIAGVMGGYDSEITKSTSRILLESAIFDHVSIRKTSREFNLFSDAASRFSKGIGRELSMLALIRFAQLFEELGAGKAISDVVKAGSDYEKYKTIILNPKKVISIAGQHIKTNEMSNYLVRLGFGVRLLDNGHLEVKSPSRRIDIVEEVDLVEEVLRLKGFDDIKATLPKLDDIGLIPEKIRSRRKIKEILRSNGASEAVNYAFYGPEDINRLNMNEDNSVESSILIGNPLSSRNSVMRTTLLPGLINSLIYNLNRQVKGLCLSEFGTVFNSVSKSDLPIENEMIGIIGAGVQNPMSWYDKNIKYYNFYTIKGIVENIFSSLKISIEFRRTTKEYLHPGRAANIYTDDKLVGYIGELHPDVVEKLGLETEHRVVYAEINHDIIMQYSKHTQYNEISQFPSMERDLAIVIDKDIIAGDIIKLIKNSGGEILESVEMFDLYEGKQVGEGKKSCAFQLKFSLNERTLKAEEVNDAIDKIIKSLSDKHEAVLR